MKIRSRLSTNVTLFMLQITRHLRIDEDGKVRVYQKQCLVQDNEVITPLCVFGMELTEKLIEGQIAKFLKAAL